MIKISDIQDKEFLKDMINIALKTKDRKWFNQLTEQLKKLEKEDDSEIDLFNPKKNYDELEYDYYMCKTDCDLERVLIIVGNKIYQAIISKEELYESDYFVQLKDNKSYKKGDMIPKTKLHVYNNEYDNAYRFGYLEGQIDYINSVENYIDKKDNTIDWMDRKIQLLQKHNDNLKSELEKLQNNYFKNKEKKFKWKFWK